jgi:hypothetical protein
MFFWYLVFIKFTYSTPTGFHCASEPFVFFFKMFRMSLQTRTLHYICYTNCSNYNSIDIKTAICYKHTLALESLIFVSLYKASFSWTDFTRPSIISFFSCNSFLDRPSLFSQWLSFSLKALHSSCAIRTQKF